MAKFNIGDTVIYISGPGQCQWTQKYIGAEGTIIKPFGFQLSAKSKQPEYGVRFADGFKMGCQEPHLRKKPAPGQSSTESRERYLNSLKPCDPEFREDMDKYLNPVTEETMRRVVDGMREFYTRDF